MACSYCGDVAPPRWYWLPFWTAKYCPGFFVVQRGITFLNLFCAVFEPVVSCKVDSSHCCVCDLPCPPLPGS